MTGPSATPSSEEEFQGRIIVRVVCSDDGAALGVAQECAGGPRLNIRRPLRRRGDAQRAEALVRPGTVNPRGKRGHRPSSRQNASRLSSTSGVIAEIITGP